MIAAHTWKEIRFMTLFYVLLLEVVLIIGVLYWPTLRDKTESLAPLKNVLPADFMKRWVNDIMNTSADASYRAYMAIQMYFKGVNIIGISCACLFGTGLIARERENRTLEFLLSRPISRTRILLAKFAVTATAIVIPVFLTCWSAIPLSWIIKEDLPFQPVTMAAAYSALYCVLFLALCMVFSVRLRTQVHVAFVVGAIIVFQVSIYFVPDIRQWSLFRMSDYDIYGPILAGNVSVARLFWGRAVWLFLGVIACAVTAQRLFRRAEL